MASINREATADSTDEAYRIAKTERYKTITQNNYKIHLELCKSIPSEKCKVLGSLLLQNAEMNAAINKEGVQYLGLEVLNIWMEKQGSTIWVLKEHLKDLELCDTLDILQRATLDCVSLFIVIYEEVEDNSRKILYTNKSRKVPGGKSLVDVVRPIVYRILGLSMTEYREKVLSLRLVRSAEGGQELTWSSPARNFKGGQVDILMFYTSAQVPVYVRGLQQARRHTDPGQKRSEGATPVERNVISWIENDAHLCFGYADHPDPLPAGGHGAEQTVRPVQEVGGQLEALAQSLDQLSLKSDSSLESHGCQTMELRTRTTATTDADDLSGCPGLRISADDATTEETSLEDQQSQQSHI